VLTKWLKKAGERVSDESLFEISTDKVDTNPSAFGVLRRDPG
jgi:pyruvate/2-oxoglutarate dehydrogenase complex dihydrolipoamide acyltransferase (E2) component